MIFVTNVRTVRQTWTVRDAPGARTARQEGRRDVASAGKMRKRMTVLRGARRATEFAQG